MASISLIILSLNYCIFGQERRISFGKLSVEDGLSQNSIISIDQDNLGALWFATQDGLNRYDGQKFEKFNEYFDDITKPNYSRLGKVFIDNNDQVWLITKGGNLKRYLSHNFQSFTLHFIENANCIYQDHEQNILVGTRNNGLHLIHPERGVLVYKSKPEDLIYNDTINVITQDDEKKYWIGTSSGVYHSKSIKGEFEILEFENPNDKTSISTLTVDRNGTLWAGTYEKGLFYKKSKDSFLKSFDTSRQNENSASLNKINVLSLFVDHSNRLWIGTYGDGLFLIDGARIQNFTLQKNNPNSISYNDILCVFEDSNQVIWCGTDGGGVSFYDENLHKFNSYTNSDVPEDVHVDVIRSIIKDTEDVVWIGTSGYGLTKYNPNNNVKWGTINSSNSGLSNDRIMCLSEDKDHLIWIGTQGNGLDIFDPRSNRFENYYTGNKKAFLPDHTIWTIFHDSNNRHWIGTRDHGLCLFDETKGIINQYTPSTSGIPGASIRVIIEEDENSLWIGTENNGICRLDINEENFEVYQVKTDSGSSLSTNLTKSLYLHENYLWIGTSGGGLNVLNLHDESIKVYTTSDGLPNNVIYAILPDDNLNLWLSTNRGISKFTPPNLPTHKESYAVIVNYDNYDGLQGLEFNTGAYFKDNDGYLYFGGINGYNWFKPSEIILNKKSSRAILNNIDVNGVPMRSDTIISRIRSIDLNYNENALSFSFSTLNFSMPQRNIYKYKLLGYDDEWISSGFRNYVNYTNLAPGSYRFDVLGGNYDGIFHELPASIDITIHPPWWKTNWVYLFATLFIALFSFLVYRFQRNRWLLKTQLQLEHQETSRLKELDLFKSKLYTNITHEFRTPLTVILGLIEKSKQYIHTNNTSNFHEVTDIVQRNANRLLNLVNQMLDLSKLESKSIRLQMVNGDIVFFLKKLVAMFESHAATFNLKLNFKSSKEKLLMDYDPENIQKIISNLLSNAIKFTNNGEIALSVDQEKTNGRHFLKIQVSDTGIGISKDSLPNIFDRFYQVEDTDKKTIEGSGIGMALVKELVEIMGGDIKITSKLGEGTTVSFTLPITHEAEQHEQPTDQLFKTLDEPLDVSTPHEFSLEEEGNPIVLLIEDNSDVLYYLNTCLHDKYRLVQAIDGNMGIEKALEYVPDIIISDVMMPGKTGLEVCEILKKDTRTSHIPIILLTAKAEIQDKISGIKYGADAYLIKPFNVDELLAQVENLIRSREILFEKFQSAQHENIQLVDYPEKENEFLSGLNGLIMKELNNPDLNVEKVCEQLYMSRTQLHRKIKALTDKSITAYIRSFRLQEALRLIKNTSNTIQQIAYETGFSNASYFNRTFVKEYKKKPTDIRK